MLFFNTSTRTHTRALQLRTYERLTKLTVAERSLSRWENVQPGDCIVCFNKANIFSVSRELERRGHQAAVIYGSLSPGAKLAQAAKFNDPSNPCKVRALSPLLPLLYFTLLYSTPLYFTLFYFSLTRTHAAHMQIRLLLLYENTLVI